MRRHLPTLLNLLLVCALAAVLALAAVPTRAPAAPETTAGRGATVEHVRVPAASRARAVLPQRRTPSFALLGITWDGGQEQVTARVRTLGPRGWSGWTALESHGEEVGDGTSVGRGGTDPLWVREAKGVAVDVRAADGSVPAGVRVELVDPGTDPLLQTMADGSPGYTAMPGMIRRTQWGARAASDCSDLLSKRTKGVIFHHTAGSNSYTRAESWSIVRSIQAFHMDGRGWCDIGYNFLVDKYGQVFEGRAGGPLWHSRAAHAGNWEVNTYAMGVSMIGNLDEVRPSTAMKDATVRLIGWRIGTNYLPARGSWLADGGKRLLRISGHRQVAEAGITPSTRTACPGYYGMQWLRESGGLRDRVAAYVADYDTGLKRRYESMGWRVTGTPYVGEYTTAGGRKTRLGNGDLLWRNGLPTTWVTAPILAAYDARGAQAGALGFPLGDARRASDGSVSQSFEGGTLTYVPGSGTTFRPR